MNPSIKRLMKEASELSEPTYYYHAHPLEDNLFEWHFTIRGADETEFEGGRYHGRIILPPEYPMKPPSVIMLTPNGRFEINKKICLSLSDYHPEEWLPVWGIRTILLAIIGFLPSEANGSIASLNYPKEARKELALKSLSFVCPDCGDQSINVLKETHEEINNFKDETSQLIGLITLKDEDIHSTTKLSNETIQIEEKNENINENIYIPTETVSCKFNSTKIEEHFNETTTEPLKEDSKIFHHHFYDLNNVDKQQLIVYQLLDNYRKNICLINELITKRNESNLDGSNSNNNKTVRHLYNNQPLHYPLVIVVLIISFITVLFVDLQLEYNFN